MLRAHRFRASGSALIALVTSACGSADAGNGVEIRDEDGVRVVVNRSPEHAPGNWAVTSEPRLVIGAVSGEEPYLFQRITHAHVRPDGSILVVDGGASSIRIYAPDGTHVRSSGRAGDGPGEFRNLVSVRRLPGDTLAFIEFPGSRISFFDDDGEFVRTLTAPAFAGPTWFLSTDRYLYDLTERGAGPADGPTRLSRHVVLGTGAGIGSDTIARLASTDGLAVREGDMVVMVRRPFTQPDLLLAAPPDRVITTGEGYELVLRSAGGEIVTRTSIAREPRAVTQQDFERARDEDLGRAREMRERMPGGESGLRARERGWSMLDAPSHMPAFDELRTDALGMIWARGYVAPGDTASVHDWFVFDRDGRWLTNVETPARLRILDIGERHVMGVEVDELDVQRLYVYDLDRRQ